MHTPAPPSPQAFPPVLLTGLPQQKQRRAGFSLIEVTLAIAIIAFAFIALIGLLPAGMSVFTQTMDSTNEMRIVSHLTSMMQSTYYDKLNDQSFSQTIYYYDVDGGFLDTKQEQKGYAKERVYAARVVFDDQNVPQGTGGEFYDRPTVALKGVVYIGKANQTVEDFLASVANVTESLENMPPKHKVRVFPVLISKTDSIED